MISRKHNVYTPESMDCHELPIIQGKAEGCAAAAEDMASAQAQERLVRIGGRRGTARGRCREARMNPHGAEHTAALLSTMGLEVDCQLLNGAVGRILRR